jgi:tetratricopeptide (TPR) repeat protein
MLMKKNNYLLTATIVGFLFILSFQSPVEGQTVAPVRSEDAEKWRQDLRFMAQEMPKKHANLFHAITREEFDAAVKKLDQRIPKLARHQIIVEMARIVAMVGKDRDGHTSLPLLPLHFTGGEFKVGFRQYPLRLHLFNDGFFVEATTSEYAGINGARLIKIGSVSVEDAYKKASEIVSRDNEITPQDRVPQLLTVPEVLHALGLIDNMEKTSFTVELKGRQTTVAASPLPADQEIKWIEARQATANPPLWLKDPNNLYWFEYLPDSKTVYFQYNGVVNKHGGESLSSFFKKLFAFIEANPVDRLIIDMRRNGGGNGVLSWGLIYGILRSDKINQKDKLFTIIGRHTYSAGSATAAMLGLHTKTTFVGEPPSGGVNVYGDHASIVLPNSGVELFVAPFFFQNTYPWDKRPWIEPKVKAEMSSSDYRSDTDPAMNAIFNYQPIGDVLTKALSEGGLELLIKRYSEFRSSPKTSPINTESDVNDFAYGLLRNKQFNEAIEVFKLNVKSYPQSSNAYDSLGDAYRQSGNIELAVKSYEKALELNPSSTYIAQKLRAIRN